MPRVGAILTGYRIAVVDDDEGVLESLTNLLESHRYSVHGYESARAFLEDDILPQIDCLISDVSMPGIDGFQLRRLLEEVRPTLPVILITARPDVSAHNLSSGNVRGLLQKPFVCSDLLDALASAITQSHYDR